MIGSVPFIHEDDLLYQCLDDMGEDKARELLHLLREVVERMPEGEEMLQSISSRLYADQRRRKHVPIIRNAFTERITSEHEHRRMIIRRNIQKAISQSVVHGK